MSSSGKGGKRISVFDRLGPGNDESPSAHRRFSSDKHPSSSTEKPGRHGYLSRTEPPPPGASSRIPPPPLPPPSSRHRHFHGSPEAEFPGEEELGPRPSPVERRAPARTSKPRGEAAGDIDGHKHHPPPPALDDRPRDKGAHGRGSLSPSDGGSGGEEAKRRGRGHQQDRRLKYGPEILSSASDDSLRRGSKHSVGGGGGGGERKLGSDRHSERPQSAALPIVSSLEVKGRTTRSGREERGGGGGGGEGASHHGSRRRKEEEPGTEAPPRDRKRKREQDDEEYLIDFEPKRLRSGDHGKESERNQRPLREQQQQQQGEEDKQHGSSSRGEGPERKRRHDSVKEGPPRKRPRDSTPPPSKKHASGAGPTSTKRSTEYSKSKTDKTDKAVDVPAIASEGDSINSGGGGGGGGGGEGEDTPKRLNWSTLRTLISPRPEWRSHRARDRFTPGAIFAEVGVSPSLAGKHYYDKINRLVSEHLKQSQDMLDPLKSNKLPEAVVTDPFNGAGFASVGVARIKEQVDWSCTFSEVGQHRRALTASADYSLRRKLRKKSEGQYLTASQAVSSWPDSEHYSNAVALYNSLGKRASGKPAFRVQPSTVGALLVAR